MFYLDGVQIDEPTGWSGVYWTRVRNPEYFGIWRQKTATVKGVGEVGFSGDERDYLRMLWKKHSGNAKSQFEVMENDIPLYSSAVDFGNWSDNGRFFNVNFRDEDVQLDSLAETLVQIEPEIQIHFPEQAISAGIAYAIGADFSTQFSGGRHSIPLTTGSNSAGNGLSVSTLGAVESIYRNGSDKDTTVRVEGSILGKWAGSGNVSISLETWIDGVRKDTKVIAVVPVSMTEQKVFLAGTIQVPVGYNVQLNVTVSGGSTIQYNQQSSITIYEDSAVTSQFVWGLTWLQAIRKTVKALCGDSVTISSRFLTTGTGARRTITSEANLRGVRSKMQVSLKSLLKDFCTIENLAVWKRESVLFIETKSEMIKRVGRSRIDGYAQLLETPLLVEAPLPCYVSTIGVSYSNWKSSTQAGLDEFCSERTFVTSQTSLKSNFNMPISSVSASGKIMESLRRNISAEKADTNQDQNLFVIAATKKGDYYLADTGKVYGVIDPAAAINGELSPRQILKRWANCFGVSGTAVFQSGSGNNEAQIDWEPENANIQPPAKLLFTGKKVTIQTAMKLKQYSELGEVIEYVDHDGAERSFLVSGDSYRFTGGMLTISGYQLNE